jgi:hypothetical protein
MAAFLMAISSLSVTLNSMAMRGFRPPIRRGGGTARRSAEEGMPTRRAQEARA